MYEIIQGYDSVVQGRVNLLLSQGWFLYGPLRTHLNQDGYMICAQVMTNFPTKPQAKEVMVTHED